MPKDGNHDGTRSRPIKFPPKKDTPPPVKKTPPPKNK